MELFLLHRLQTFMIRKNCQAAARKEANNPRFKLSRLGRCIQTYRDATNGDVCIPSIFDNTFADQLFPTWEKYRNVHLQVL